MSYSGAGIGGSSGISGGGLRQCVLRSRAAAEAGGGGSPVLLPPMSPLQADDGSVSAVGSSVNGGRSEGGVEGRSIPASELPPTPIGKRRSRKKSVSASGYLDMHEEELTEAIRASGADLSTPPASVTPAPGSPQSYDVPLGGGGGLAFNAASPSMMRLLEARPSGQEVAHPITPGSPPTSIELAQTSSLQDSGQQGTPPARVSAGPLQLLGVGASLPRSPLHLQQQNQSEGVDIPSYSFHKLQGGADSPSHSERISFAGTAAGDLSYTSTGSTEIPLFR